MITAFSTQHKFQSKRDETLLLQTDLSRANTVIPKPIQWKDVNLPEEWILEGAAPPAIPKQLEPNTELQNVTQYSDGKVKLSFRRSNSSRFSDKASCSSIPSLERKFTKVPSVINLPFQSQPRFSTSDLPSSSISSVDYTTKVSKTSQKLVQESKSDFAKAIREQLDRIEAASSSSSKVQIAPDTPQSSKIDTPQLSRIGVLDQDQVSIASSDLEAFTEEPIPKANKIHWELALPTSKSPPDLIIDNRPSALNQARYNASSVYEWNLDGMSEYNILGVLRQMTMAANAYKTQSGTSDRAIAEILIAGFTGQLKGWWDHLLTKLQQLDILNAIQTDENGAPILDELNNPIQDAVATLILTISLHFIGDPSHLRDKNAELLHNLRCRKLSDFNDYKTTFFTRLFLRDDANHVTWKEKFLAGLPTLLGEKVRNSIKALFDNRIPYDELAYGELVSFVNKEGLKICQDLKLQKRLKQELRQSKQELGGFCKQFNYDPFKTSTSKDCNGHTARFCKMNRRLHELGLEEEILSKIAPLLVGSSDSESSWSDDFAMDAIALFDTGADLNCIREDIVPKRFREKTKERLSAANNSKLNVTSKVDASIYNDKIEFKTSFVLTNDIHHAIILGTPFINLITPYAVNYDEEHTKVVRLIKQSVKSIPCLHLANPAFPKIVETDASDLGYGASEILTPNALQCLNLFKANYKPTESEKRFPHFLCFCTNFFLPWVWMWSLRHHTQDSHFILQRTFRVKWWSKFDEQTKLTTNLVQNWLSAQGHLQPAIKDIKAQGTFLTQKSKAQALLASAKTEEEYFKAMEQLLASRSKSSVADSTEDEDDDDEPTVSLGDENEDDCFGIFSPIKHCK
ncbi:hypothetical protein KPL71_021575 [Citrus sinensis]|uniref:Uncharacterized protein n=1 Tax=Citrus sinensis TaxID=2711 RepID=A0ACB8JHP2_CITSI|nr:hypothetical protein KPL71_021575 [Citrus sinensis]